jgi:hypothetical protein
MTSGIKIFDKYTNSGMSKTLKFHYRHQEEHNTQVREDYYNTKIEIFKILGGKCVSCSYSGIALQIDHVNDDGFKERPYGKISGGSYYTKILKKIKEGSKDYQLMCPTCNWEKRLKKGEEV